MRIFIAGTSLMPNYGGPAFSVSRMALALADAGAEVGLWTADNSALTTPLLSPRLRLKILIGTEIEALDCFGEASIIHDNGMWLPYHHRLASQAKRRRIPRIVSTRGMLEPWALKHKRFKKLLPWLIYQRHDLKVASCLHATSDAEAQNLRCLELETPVALIPNGVDIPERADTAIASSEDRTYRTALFLGRIYPIKGLPLLIEAWSRVRPAGWRLRIAGPDQAGHRKRLESEVTARGLAGVVSFIGEIDPQLKDSIFFDADLFILPTHSESFGMVIAEALAHGLPVLTTIGAPWPALEQKGCGWRTEVNVDSISARLHQATLLSLETLRAMGARGQAYVAEEFGWKKIADLMLLTYEKILTAKSRKTGPSINDTE